jgi:integrase
MASINRKLTDLEIKSSKPKNKPYRIYDEGGLQILIRPSGTKVWQYPFQIAGNRNVYTIGKYGQGDGYINSKDARTIRNQVRDMVLKGINPNQKKLKNTFEALGKEWMEKQTWAEKHGKNVRSRLKKDVFNEIGHKAIRDVTVADIVRVLKKIESRGANDVAKRIGQYCASIFDYAILTGLCDNNPALGRSRLVKSVKRQNRPHLTEAQLPDFMRKLHGFNGKPSFKLMVKLLALTFVRPGELRGALWAEIDEEKALWLIPAERMKMSREHIVPLSRQSLETISELRQISGSTKYLFPGSTKETKPITDVAVIKAVKYFTDGRSVPHGFRHTASTILNETGFNADHIEAQLAHVEENKIRGTYNKAQYLEPRREMMQWWADYLDNIGYKKYD